MADIADIKLSNGQITKIKEICKSFGNKPTELINVLHQTQGFLGFLPRSSQELIAKELDMAIAKVYGVITFYSFFTMKPKGKYPISICMGTACYVRGAEKVLDELKKVLKINVGETTPDGKFSIDSLRCVGACGLAPVVLIGEKTYGRVEVKDVETILAEYE